MAGIYFHIPFCKTSCVYCDFYHTIDLRRMRELGECLQREIEERRNYLEGEAVESIYFGGGTPSLMAPDFYKKCIDDITNWFQVDSCLEITLEANPDDINRDFVKALRRAGINRISLGVQSFQNFVLKFMERRHTAGKAMEAIDIICQEGITNMSVDLIYGAPGYTRDHLVQDLQIVERFHIPHFSAYLLTPEKGTVLYQKIVDEEVHLPGEEEQFEQYMMLCEFSASRGYRHYEISNFCREGSMAKHNKGYWEGKIYCGIGPSAHSYNGRSRRWNISSLYHYILAVKEGKRYYEEEQLSGKDRYNEYLLTGLRTDDGVTAEKIRENFGEELERYFVKCISKYAGKGHIEVERGKYRLTDLGMFISDSIISSLFI